jgi:hypothetical protein
MTESKWRWISASVKGTSHEKSGTECQDSHLCQELSSKHGVVLLLLTSDGAGSAKLSAAGSKLACETIRDQVEQYLAEDGEVNQINDRLVARWIEEFRSEVMLLAESEGVSEKEFACTLIGAIVGSSCAAFFQIGDGAVVFSQQAGGPYSLAFWPERGEYENVTYFATQSTFVEQLQFLLVKEGVIEVGLLSDGLQRLALDYQTRAAHSGFFNGFFPKVRSISEPELATMNGQLTSFLNSEKVNQRTDDDKTLVLAVAG